MRQVQCTGTCRIRGGRKPNLIIIQHRLCQFLDELISCRAFFLRSDERLRQAKGDERNKVLFAILKGQFFTQLKSQRLTLISTKYSMLVPYCLCQDVSFYARNQYIIHCICQYFLHDSKKLNTSCYHT